MLTMNVALVSYIKSRVSEPKFIGSASSLRKPPFDIELRTISNILIYKQIITTTLFEIIKYHRVIFQ